MGYERLAPGEDTIAAIATPIGRAGLSVIRISGGDSIRVAACIFFRPIDDAPSHTVHLGIAKDPRTGEPIDKVLLTLFRSPKSYTGEDVVELSCHGGTAVARRLLEAVIAAGARHAEPGEFTKRAFLNGRMDLAQAEAVNDLIRAGTDEARKVALRQLEGGLSTEVKAASSELSGILAEIEASVDFPDDVDEPQSASLRQGIGSVVERLERLLASADRGRVYREGVVVTIAGKPNVGKSSLLNALLRESRAIVTPIPGTTRDTIEETVNIRGVPVVAIDTAGLRETEDTVEKVGVEKAEDAIERAHVLLMVADASNFADVCLSDDKPPPLDGNFPLGGDFRIATSKLNRDFRIPKGKPAILVLNKIDLLSAEDASRAVKAAQAGSGAGVVAVSALTGAGIGEMEDKIAEIALSGDVDASENVLVSNARHKSALERAVGSLRRAIQTVEQNLPVDLVSVDLMAARNTLGEITGETATEDLIDRIFSEFCIGK